MEARRFQLAGGGCRRRQRLSISRRQR